MQRRLDEQNQLIATKMHEAAISTPAVKGRMFEDDLVEFARSTLEPLIAGDRVRVDVKSRVAHSAEVHISAQGTVLGVLDAKWYNNTVPSDEVAKLVNDRAKQKASGSVIASKSSAISIGDGKPRAEPSLERDILYLPNLRDHVEPSRKFLFAYVLIQLERHRGALSSLRQDDALHSISQVCNMYRGHHGAVLKLAVDAAKAESQLRTDIGGELNQLCKRYGLPPIRAKNHKSRAQREQLGALAAR